MREAIEKVLEAMREDYKRWSDRCFRSDGYAESRKKIYGSERWFRR